MKHGDIEGQGSVSVAGASTTPPIADTIYKDSIIKAWIYFSSIGATTINDSFNIASITDVGVGGISLNFDLDFATVNYCIVGSSGEFQVPFGGPAVGAITVNSVNGANVSVDTARNWVLAMGDQ